MKKIILLLAMALSMSSFGLAQGNAKTDDAKQGNPKAHGAAKKAVTISGQVSTDGKTFVTGDDTIWTVNNPDALRGHEGQQVTVKCQIHAEKNEVHVFFVRAEQAETKYTANRGDSAFRR